MKKRRVLICLVIILIISAIIFINVRKAPFNKKVVVVKVEDKGLIVMDAKEDMQYPHAYNIDFSIRGDVGYKIGQELSVDYTDTITDETGLHEIKKIEILKEESDIKIPDSLMALYYTMQENATCNIKELSNKGILVEIEDSNDIPFEFDDQYYMYNRNDTTEALIKPNAIISDSIKLKSENGKTTIDVDWASVRGELEEGFYAIKLLLNNSRYDCLEIRFNILNEGVVEYETAEFTW